MSSKKKHTTLFITREVKDLIDFLADREEVTKTMFLRQAFRYFLAGDRRIDPRVMITVRTDPEYISRDTLIPAYIDWEQIAELEETAEVNHCNISQVMFQALVDYCSALLEVDSTGIVIRDRRI